MNTSTFRESDASQPLSSGAFRALADDLGRLVAPNEGAFITLGEALISARGQLVAGGEQFRTLSAMMEQGAGAHAAKTLSESRDEVLRIFAGSREVASLLRALDRALAGVDRPLAALDKIFGEVSALATNAKIQAAQVCAAGVDFSVFTKDIDRLRGLAVSAVNSASAHLTKLGAVMSEACSTADAFQRDDAAELADVASRLRERLAELAARRDHARRSLADFEQRAKAIGERVSSCIGALQINDMTSQRIGHVQAALNLLCGVVEPGLSEPDCGWVLEIDADRRRMLLGVVCSLQAAQLERAGRDFSKAIAELKANLLGLAADAEEIMAQSRKLFGDQGGDGTFIHALLSDVKRSMALLGSFRRTDKRIRACTDDLSQGFAAMSGDLDAILSVDADMRVMGLNATLKCTRLGRDGLALGVVAQELRACSRRTEETSKTIVGAIATVSTDVASLVELSRQEGKAAKTVAARMEESAAVLQEFNGVLDSAFCGMRAACEKVAELVGDASGGLGIDEVMDAGLRKVVDRLHALARDCSAENADPALVRDDIERMLGQNYTMASERMIHELFADSAAHEEAGPDEVNAQDADIDDLFF